jgi:ABC-type multidrug transport system fused ATPase/permease subunit
MAFQHVFAVLKDFSINNRMLVMSNILFLFLYPLQDILLPHYYGKIMDAISSKRQVGKYLILVVSLLVFLQIMFLIGDYHNSKMIPKLEDHIRNNIINNILVRYETQYQELEIGDIITKLIKVPTITVIWFDRIKSYVLPYILVFAFAICYFIYADWMIGVGLLITVIAFLFIVMKSPASCAQISTTRDKSFNDINKQIDDILNNLFSVYGGGQKEYEIQRLRQYSNVYSQYYQSTMNCALGKMIVANPIIIIYIVFLIYRCNYLITRKLMAPSLFISVFIIFLYILDALLVMNDQIRDIIFEWGMIDSSADLLYQESIGVTKDNSQKLQPMYSIPPYGIGLQNVSFKYPDSNKIILENFSLHVNSGERVCLVGDIGSGKSTIIKLLLKYNVPTSGTVYWNGISYDELDITLIRKRIGYVPQTPVLFNRSIIDNILYGNTVYIRQDVERFIKDFNLEEEFASFEDGLDTVIGKNGSKLSGGQRQLIWCLRVLLYNPDIIILDEPTASIDEKIKRILQNILSVIMRNKTVIMVTHDPYLENIATRIIKLSKGKVVSDIRRRS